MKVETGVSLHGASTFVFVAWMCNFYDCLVFILIARTSYHLCNVSRYPRNIFVTQGVGFTESTVNPQEGYIYMVHPSQDSDPVFRVLLTLMAPRSPLLSPWVSN